jgi:hypothetical protein
VEHAKKKEEKNEGKDKILDKCLQESKDVFIFALRKEPV